MAGAFRDWDEIMELAETDPDQKIWCISMDGGTDFVMTAKEIKQTVGNYDWHGVSFGIINEDHAEDRSENQSEACDPSECDYYEGKHAYKDDLYIQKSQVKVKFFTAIELKALEERINSFIKDLDVINIKFETSIAGSKEEVINKKTCKSNSVVYTAMIIYRIVEN